jgi:hypothetical protein
MCKSRGLKKHEKARATCRKTGDNKCESGGLGGTIRKVGQGQNTMGFIDCDNKLDLHFGNDEKLPKIFKLGIDEEREK